MDVLKQRVIIHDTASISPWYRGSGREIYNSERAAPLWTFRDIRNEYAALVPVTLCAKYLLLAVTEENLPPFSMKITKITVKIE